MAKVKMEGDLPSNSRASTKPVRVLETHNELEVIKPGRRNITPRAQAIRKKRNLSQTIAQSLVGQATQDVGSYIVNEVLLPAAKETIQQMVEKGIEMFLFGEAGRSRPRDKDRTRVSYASYYKGGRDRDDDRYERRPRARRGDRFDLNSIFFRDGAEADDVLRGLCDQLEEYEQVTVADYFDMAGIDGADWVHHKWGWDETSDLGRARCTHTRNGWAILLPAPIELED